MAPTFGRVGGVPTYQWCTYQSNIGVPTTKLWGYTLLLTSR